MMCLIDVLNYVSLFFVDTRFYLILLGISLLTNIIYTIKEGEGFNFSEFLIGLFFIVCFLFFMIGVFYFSSLCSLLLSNMFGLMETPFSLFVGAIFNIVFFWGWFSLANEFSLFTDFIEFVKGAVKVASVVLVSIILAIGVHMFF